MKKNMNKILVVALAVTMIALASVSATLAWLYDKEDVNISTFTVGKVYISLSDTEISFHIVPGAREKKTPVITVEKDSEKAYVFVEIEESIGALNVDGKNYTFATFVTYTKDSAWQPVPGETNVYYQLVNKSAEDQTLPLLAVIPDDADGNTISYPGNITNDMLQPAQTATSGAAGTPPTLKYTAYAIQADYTGTAAEAWAKVEAAYPQNNG